MVSIIKLVCKLKGIINKKRLILVTDLDRSIVEEMYMEYAASVEEAVKKAMGQHDKADVAIFPFGAETLPVIRK